MLAPRNRGAFVRLAFGLLALASACSNGTEPKPQSVCDATNPITLGAGEVRTPISDACVYISAGSGGGEYALVPFNSATADSITASLTFTSSGVGAITTPLQSRTFALGPSLSLTPSGTSAAAVASHAF